MTVNHSTGDSLSVKQSIVVPLSAVLMPKLDTQVLWTNLARLYIETPLSTRTMAKLNTQVPMTNVTKLNIKAPLSIRTVTRLSIQVPMTSTNRTKRNIKAP